MLNLSLMNPLTTPTGMLWVANYNGINSYGEILPWGDETAGSLDIEFDTWVESGNRNAYFFDGREEGGSGIGFLYFSSDGSHLINRYNGTLTINGVETDEISEGFNHIKITGGRGKVRRIGSRWAGSHFKGQIYNLRLTKRNASGENKFLSGTIRSLSMPKSVVLKDELAVRPPFYQCQDFWTNPDDPDNKNWVGGISGNMTGQSITMRFGDDQDFRSFPWGAILTSPDGRMFQVRKAARDPSAHTPVAIYQGDGGDKWDYRRSFMFPNKFSSNAARTDGILYNFGTEFPWVEMKQ